MENLSNTLIPVWKPKNIYSTDIVRFIRKKYQVKAGHAGTLDPFAEGVLIIATGSKTKLIEDNQLLSKTYRGVVELGKETNTLDVLGETFKEKPLIGITESKVKSVLSTFTGIIKQRPPAFSALRKNNVRLYKLARKDVYINLKPREVEIYSIELISFKANLIEIEVKCGKGTYIRSLARDIGLKLNTFGYLKSLKRLSVGPYNREDCLNINFAESKD